MEITSVGYIRPREGPSHSGVGKISTVVACLEVMFLGPPLHMDPILFQYVAVQMKISI